MLVALKGGELAGGLTAYELPGYKSTKSKMFLYEIGVKPEWRRQGIGRQLVNELLEQCKKRGIKKLFVETSRDNTAAMKLFEATGGEVHPNGITFSYTVIEF